MMSNEEYQIKCICEYLYNLGNRLENDLIIAENNIIQCRKFISDDKYIRVLRCNNRIEFYKEIYRDIYTILKFKAY